MIIVPTVGHVNELHNTVATAIMEAAVWLLLRHLRFFQNEEVFFSRANFEPCRNIESINRVRRTCHRTARTPAFMLIGS